jgi:hypothetical protein
MQRAQRLDAVTAAVRILAAHPDPGGLSDGLSPAMAAACLGFACAEITRSALAEAIGVPGVAPRLAAVVAARGVFTAPLEWVALLAAVGSEVILKAPSAAPDFGHALAEAFSGAGLPVRCSTERDLPAVDALVAMGGDPAIRSLAERNARARLSLHGHRFSLAVVHGSSPELARQLAQDALLYDGRGCFTPVAVLHTGPLAAADRLAFALEEQLRLVAQQLPAGPMDPLLGPEWRRRAGLASALGALRGGTRPCSALLPPDRLEASALPGYLPVHPLTSLEQLEPLLAPYAPWLAACATDLDSPQPLLAAGFERICRPGALQRPPLLRSHGGRAMLRPLMFEPSLEL